VRVSGWQGRDGLARVKEVDDSFYRAAEQFVTNCLKNGQSLFAPARSVWTVGPINELYYRFVGNPDYSKGPDFIQKLEGQLAGAPPDVVALGGEVLYLLLLAQATNPETKRASVRAILSAAEHPVTIPDDLSEALAHGFSSFGAALTHRFEQFCFLLEFARAWAALDSQRRQALLTDPEVFRAFVFTLEQKGAASEVEALLYIVFPDYFEPITSVKVKRQIAESFGEPVDGDKQSIDQRLVNIRAALQVEYGEGFSFYDEPLRQRWESTPVDSDGDLLAGEQDVWNAFLSWAEKLYAEDTFDATERDYKLVIADNLTGVKELLETGGDWLPALLDALRRQNNLIYWKVAVDFAGWAETHPQDCADALRALWGETRADPEAIDDFASRLDYDVTPGNSVVLASVLLMASDPAVYPPFRPFLETGARDLLEVAKPEQEPGRRYLAFLELCDRVMDGLAARGAPVRDRLDAQSLLYWVIKNDPPATWTEEEREAFLTYRDGGRPIDVPPGEPRALGSFPDVDQALAARLFLPRDWLQEAVDLVNEKRQAIFYGPPGTGKTYVAQALGDLVVAAGGSFRLVQFHPSYSYEDFFEGYRPTNLGDGGAVRFELRPGPLQLIASEAAANPERPFLLVIDEINRGNIAKIFGELYFLLEYRDHPVQLQYSPATTFALPPNLFLIGTMNTADRSIALIDSALRRRFYFYPFLPREPPVDDVLGRWLAANGHDPEPAELLRTLNEALGDALPADDFAVGPSYLMTANGPPDLDRVWRYAIAPLLEERFYGARTPSEIEKEFGLAAIRARARTNNEATEAPDPAGGA